MCIRDRRAWDKNVQIIVEGPGHMPLNQKMCIRDRCHSLANDQYQSLLGMSLDMILSLPSETVFDLVVNCGEVEPKKVLTLVDVYKRQG